MSEAQSRRTDRDYVLGTHDAEVARLAFQHEMWRGEVAKAWDHAGIGRGARVADLGAGPGFATLDLAERVGPEGEVLAVERSGRFLALLDEEARLRGLPQVKTAELDLMLDEIPARGLDAAWCRWVACFVPDPELLVRRIADCLRRGGSAVFHEYVEYHSYGLLPASAAVDGFVDAVFENWRAHGGEPDIARELPRMLSAHGFELTAVRPIARCARPSDPLWNWPAGFIRTNVPRLVELGVRGQDWARDVLAEVDKAERNPASVFITPTVLEIVATKR